MKINYLKMKEMENSGMYPWKWADTFKRNMSDGVPVIGDYDNDGDLTYSL